MSCSERQKSLIIAAQMKTFVAKIIKIPTSNSFKD
jgi:hypothetical protein